LLAGRISHPLLIFLMTILHASESQKSISGSEASGGFWKVWI